MWVHQNQDQNYAGGDAGSGTPNSKSSFHQLYATKYIKLLNTLLFIEFQICNGIEPESANSYHKTNQQTTSFITQL